MTTVPLFPLGTLLVPGQALTLNVFEPRYRRLVADLQALPPAERRFAVVAILAGHEVGSGAAVATASVGTMAQVRRIEPGPGQTLRLTAVGRTRFVVDARYPGPNGYDVAQVSELPDSRQPAIDADAATNALADRVAAHLCLLLEAHGRPIPQLPESPDALSFAVVLAAPLDPHDQLALLGVDRTRERLLAEIRLLRRERHLMNALKAASRSGPLQVPPGN